MNTSSLELSKELYELSGWTVTDYVWRHHKPNDASQLELRVAKEADDYRFRNSPEAKRFREENAFYPAYDLGYLLRKLPRQKDMYDLVLATYVDVYTEREGWICGFQQRDNFIDPVNIADTPEDAAAKLCIELFKQGIIKP